MPQIIAVGGIFVLFAMILGFAFWRGAKAGRDDQMSDSLKDANAALTRGAKAVANAPRGKDLPDALRKGKAL